MLESTAVVIESQPDYLTCSAHGADAAANLHLWALLRQHEQEQAGNRLRPFRLQGYEGIGCGAVEWGRRDAAAVLVRLAGDVAAVHLSDALSLADRVSRVDLAVTVRFRPADPHVGSNTYFQAEQFHTANPPSALPWRVTDADGGSTTYVGKRGSDNMLRVYNKEAECLAAHDDEGVKRYEACWRFELEAKGGMAQPLARAVDERSDRAAYIQAYVHGWAVAHGILPLWEPSGSQALIPGFRRRSDADTRLLHLARNVRPTVDWLLANGYGDRVRDTLGLP